MVACFALLEFLLRMLALGDINVAPEAAECLFVAVERNKTPQKHAAAFYPNLFAFYFSTKTDNFPDTFPVRVRVGATKKEGFGQPYCHFPWVLLCTEQYEGAWGIFPSPSAGWQTEPSTLIPRVSVAWHLRSRKTSTRPGAYTWAGTATAGVAASCLRRLRRKTLMIS